MKAASRSPLPSDWRELANLGEQIVSTTSLAAQKDRIIAMTAHLVEGEVEIWLRENLFRLPGLDEPSLFPEEPSSRGMQNALKFGKVRTKQKRGKTSASRATWAAIPIEDQGIRLGVLQVSRPKGPEFRSEELDLLQGLAGIVAVSLVASHRLAVERFRLNQLNLVREVSAQIANVLNLDELAKRVTQLIQQTFHFYYVAIFTVREASPL